MECNLYPRRTFPQRMSQGMLLCHLVGQMAALWLPVRLP